MNNVELSLSISLSLFSPSLNPLSFSQGVHLEKLVEASQFISESLGRKSSSKVTQALTCKM